MFKDLKKFFADFINNLRKRRTFKYVPFIAIPCLLAILIPTIFAVWHVYFKDETLFDAHDVSVTLYNNEGKLIATETVIESYTDSSPLTSVFYALNSGKSFDTQPEGCISKPNYKVSIDYGDSYVEYDCYFTKSPTASYLYSDGKYFLVAEEPYVKFLSYGYSEDAYTNATPPLLLTKQGETVIPSQVYWQYKNYDGEIKFSKNIETTAKVQNFQMSGSIFLEFDRLPNVCSVKVSDNGGEILYEGDLDRLSFITSEPGAVLTLDITASWARTEDCDSYGIVDYNFTVVCKNYAAFDISASEARPGEFILLSVSNVDQNSEIIYAPVTAAEAEDVENNAEKLSAQQIMQSVTPIFSYSTDGAYALLPIPYGTPEGEFGFTLSSGAASKEFTVKINEAAQKSEVTLTKSKKVINNAISSAALGELDHALTDISLRSSKSIFFRGEFGSFDTSAFSGGFSYGDHFIIGENLNEEYAATGNDYVSLNGADATVASLNVGRVVYTGYILHLGNFAVVDHGMGIATWYCHLSALDCAVGDVLAKGEAIGKCGESVFLEESGVLILCSVNGQFVDPDLILGKELLYNETHVSGGNNNDVQ